MVVVFGKKARGSRLQQSRGIATPLAAELYPLISSHAHPHRHTSQYLVALGQELRIVPANIKSPLRLTDSSERAPAEICDANFLFLCKERSHVTNGRHQKAGQAAWYELCNELRQRSMAGCTAIERHYTQLRRAITPGRDALHSSSWKCRPVTVTRR